MSNVGFASLQIIPSAKGFAENLDRQVAGPMAQSGQKAGGGFAKTFGKAAVAGLAVVGAGVSAFAVKASAKFAEVGGEVSKLSRFTGLAAEDASRLRFAGKQAGVGADVLTKSLGLLSKNLAGKSLDKLGFSFKDAQGKAKPLNDDLLEIAKRFKTLPNGAEKTALAMKLFGRSGADLIPFLNRGADGIAELERQSDKFGTTLSGKDLDAVKASTAAHRAFDAAMEGLQIQVGRYVLPIFTQFVSFATTSLMPAIGAVSDLTRKYLAPAFDFAFGVIGRVMSEAAGFIAGTLVPAFQTGIAKIIEIVTPFAERGWAAFERIRQAVDDRLTPALRDRLMPVLRKVVMFIGDNLAPALAGVGAATGFAVASQIATFAGSLGGVVQAIAVLPNPAILAVAAVASLVAGFVYAYKHSERFREIADKTAEFLKGKFADAVATARDLWPKFVDGVREAVRVFQTDVIPVIQAFVGFLQTKVIPAVTGFVSYLVAEFADLVGFVRQHWAAISEAIGHVVEAIKVIVTVAVNIISALWRAWGDDLLHFAEAVFGRIRDTISNILMVIRGVIDVVLSLINGDWGKAWDGMKEIVSGIFRAIGDNIGLILDSIKALIGGVLSTIAQVWAGTWSGIKDVAADAWAAVVRVVSSGIESVIGFVTGLAGRLSSAAGDLWGWVTSGLGGILDHVVGLFRSAINLVISVINAAIHAYNLLPLHKDVGTIAPVGSSGGVGDPVIASGPNRGKDPHHLAAGAYVKRRPGGIFANVGEGRYDEAVLPVSSRALAPLAKAMAPMLAPAKGNGAIAFGPFHLTVQATPGADGRKFGRDAVSEITKLMRIDPAFKAAVREAVA